MILPKSLTSTATSTSDNVHVNKSSTTELVKSSTSEELNLKRKRTLEMIPEFLPGHSPIFPSRIERKRNQEKLNDVVENINRNLLENKLMPLRELDELKQKAALYDEMMQQLKNKYSRLEPI